MARPIFDPIRPKPPAKAFSGQKQASAKAPQIPPSITADDIRAAIESLAEATQELQLTTQTGATVINLALLDQLNKAERQVAPEMETGPGGSSFAGQSWVDMVRLGDSCFRVQRANPLEPVSYEQWYRVTCK